MVGVVIKRELSVRDLDLFLSRLGLDPQPAVEVVPLRRRLVLGIELRGELRERDSGVVYTETGRGMGCSMGCSMGCGMGCGMGCDMGCDIWGRMG